MRGFLLPSLLLMIFGGVFGVTEATDAQDLTEVMVSLELNKVPLKTAFDEIEKQTDLTFAFSYNDIDSDRSVSVQADNKSVDEILKQLFQTHWVSWALSGKTILLKKWAKPEQDDQNSAFDEPIEGQVTDAESGETLPGVNILVKGTTRGVSTDQTGHFNLEVPSLQDTLIFTYIGYQRQEVAINGRSQIDIQLVPEAIEGEEMVVVGYGMQEEESLTGAVDQINNEEFANRPITNINQGLQGISPNVNITPTSGKPIESPTINIRGETSIGQGGNALILIDGVEGDPSMLNPKDIESISVLKDASSAAIYGARASFGVIQITTKDAARNQFEVEYGSSISMKQPVVEPDFVTDGYTYASNFNRAYTNALGTNPQGVNKTLPFSQDYLDELERRSNDPSLPEVEIDENGQYVYYANNDWYDKLYKDYLLSNEHNLSVSRRTDDIEFLISGRYQGQGGLFRYNSDNYKMYNLRAKGSVELFPWLRASNNFDYAERSFFNPLNVGEGGGIWRNIADEGHPIAPMLNPDGTLTHSAAYTVGDFYYGKNGKDFQRSILRNRTEVEASFLDDHLNVFADFSFQNTKNDISEKRVPVPYSRFEGEIEYVGENQNNLAVTNDNTNYYASNLYAEYANMFLEKHNVEVTIGGNYEESTFEEVYLRRNGLAFEDADNINLALGESITTSGQYESWNILGGFYRINYNYDDRYLIEVNGRYDGSSKFPEDQRFGFFPSGSIGWRISQEPFWNISEDLISQLKIRASYGSLGNGNISPYSFQEELEIYNTNRIINGEQPQATSNPNVLPAGLTWETVTTSNIGLDLNMFSGRLQLSGDAYIRETTDMFTPALTPPRVFGASAPRGNYADLRTKGWELQASWYDGFELAGKEMSYSIGFNLSDSKAKITEYNNPDKSLDDYYEGMTVGEIWGFVSDGFFANQEQIDNHANQSEHFQPNEIDGEFRPGDIIFRDLNGDGIINDGDNTATNPGDRRVIGNSRPRYRFGANIDLNWGGFFLSSFFQGVGKQGWYPSNEANHFWGQYNRPYNDIPKWHLDEGIRWSEDNQDAFLPRYTGYIACCSEGRMLSEEQSGYLMNVAYVRLKNLQIGYDFKSEYLSDLGIRNARVYLNGTNLWTWSPLYRKADNVDVENIIAPSEQDVSGGSAGDGLNYPMLKSFTAGLSITF